MLAFIGTYILAKAPECPRYTSITNSTPITMKALECPKFTCGENLTTTGECLSYSKISKVETYTSTPCEHGLRCPFTSYSTSYCEGPPRGNRLPGDYCFSNPDCISSNCTQNICISSLSLGSSCKSSSNCPQGTYCSPANYICQYQLPAGSYCDLTWDCKNGYECDNNTCVLTFSLNNGQKTSVADSNGFSMTCSSGYAVDTDGTGKFVCAKAPQTDDSQGNRTSAGFVLCPYINYCVDTTRTIIKSCICNTDQNPVCPLLIGDEPVVLMISYWKLLNLFNKNCHTQSRYAYECFYTLGKNSLELYLYFYASYHKYFFQNISSSVNQTSCIMDNFGVTETKINYQLDFLYWNAPRCPIYTFPSYPYPFNTNQCASYTKDIYNLDVVDSFYLKTCVSGYRCDFKINSDSYCVENTPEFRHPGEYCNKSLDCYSGVCVDYKCQGKAPGKTCNNRLYCAPGLFCGLSGLCQVVFDDGASCSETYECKTLSVCQQGICTKLYSIPNDQKGTLYYNNTSYGYSETCSSGFAAINSERTPICTQAPMSSQNYSSSASFKYCYDTTFKYTKAFTCGFDGFIYCPGFEGDFYLQAAIANYRNLQSYGVSCSSDTGLTELCLGKNITLLMIYHKAYAYFSLYQSHSQINTSSDSVLQIIFPKYWNAIHFILDSPASHSICIALEVLSVLLVT